jgi:hypothetical protein
LLDQKPNFEKLSISSVPGSRRGRCFLTHFTMIAHIAMQMRAAEPTAELTITMTKLLLTAVGLGASFLTPVKKNVQINIMLFR